MYPQALPARKPLPRPGQEDRRTRGRETGWTARAAGVRARYHTSWRDPAGGVPLVVPLLIVTSLALGQVEAPEAYRIGKYDVLQIIVPEEPAEFPQVGAGSLTVGPDGRISVTFVGDLVAQGRTTTQVAEEIRQGLIDAGQFVDPHVLVRVIEYGADRVSVLGAVQEPGYFPFRDGITIRDAIAMAKGVQLDIAANSMARLVHSDGSTRSFELNEALRSEGPMADLRLAPGDAVVVEESAPVSVLGYVHEPGDVRVREGGRLSEVIGLAGGIVEPGEQTFESGRTPGDPSRVTINRADGSAETVALMSYEGGPTIEDPVIHSGDVVYVPASENEVTVLGYVTTPGVHVFRTGDRVSDAVAAAGGPVRSNGGADSILEVGDTGAVVLHHRDGTREIADLETGVAGEGDPVLQPGDTIVIPRRELVYYAVGHVGIQGRHTLPPGSRVLDLFTAARGAPLPDRVQILQVDADLENCVLARADGTQLVIDMRAVAQNPASEMNVELVPGDSLWVPESDRRVIVGGYVSSPGYFQFREGNTVSDVIAMAGGVTISPTGSYMNDGDPHSVLVIHDDGTQDTLDITRGDMVLRPGDEIRVPYARKRVTVLGYVARPGFVLWHEGDSVLDMIAAAGGPLLEDADRFSAVVIRRTDGEPEFIRVDLSGAHDMDSPEFNVEVLPDDIVMVPKSDHTDYRSWLTNVRDALSITNLIGALF
ncbi:MAG: hypothetical protein GF320_01490 [Armatimonadia bacterium]|nr:hypothetical protein [Armatimonadia bacterium]